jgi:citrate lyase subunit beta/citryl-CoA lyase
VVKVFEEEGIAKGSAAVTLDGHMVDTPVYMNALQILDTSKQIEEKEKQRAA